MYLKMNIFQLKVWELSLNAKHLLQKKFYCDKKKKEGWNSGFRITFIHCPINATIHYIEIYYKGRKEIEDKGRIVKKCHDLKESFSNNSSTSQ